MIEVGTYGYGCFSSLQLKCYILFVYSRLRFKFQFISSFHDIVHSCFMLCGIIFGIGIDERKMKSGSTEEGK